ncbi:MAG TPA: DUF5667 domain-containing protein [Candidatus Bilamarchaeum sp.]|nr:DUF5667 domain-containing protein [Candidatus Bilamarchaeum sp.]
MKNILIILLGLGLLAVPAFALETEGNNTTVKEGGKVNVSAYENVTNFTALFQATCTSDEKAQAGDLPGDFMYGFKRFFENVDKFFTMDKSESAKKHARYGKLRAVEAHLMTCKAKAQADSGDESGANQTMDTVSQLVDDHDEEITDAQDDIEAAVEDGSANETDVQEVENETRNSIIVLQRVYEKAPESAKDGLLRALNNSIDNFEKHNEKMEEKGKEKDDEDQNETNTTSSKGPKGDENETEENVTKGKSGEHGKPTVGNSTVSDDDENETSDDGPDRGSQGGSKGKGGSESEDESEDD